ncbi:ACOD desaturase, partial [Acromyrmex heyeri]
IVAIIGITAGSHRLWSHRSYKAKWPMRLILMIFQTIAFQVSFSVNFVCLAKVLHRMTHLALTIHGII